MCVPQSVEENCTVLSRYGEGRGCRGIIQDWAVISRLTASVVRHSLSFAGLLLPSGTHSVPFGSKPLGDQDSVGLWPSTYHNKWRWNKDKLASLQSSLWLTGRKTMSANQLHYIFNMFLQTNLTWSRDHAPMKNIQWWTKSVVGEL